MMRCQISEDDFPAFVAYLSLGVLEAIRAGAVAPEVGIWTLGRPITWEPLEEARLVPPEIVEILRASDELSALQKLAPHAFDAVVSDLIARLHMALKAMPDSTWQVEWSRTVPDEEA